LAAKHQNAGTYDPSEIRASKAKWCIPAIPVTPEAKAG
jgi:hypothetical protein